LDERTGTMKIKSEAARHDEICTRSFMAEVMPELQTDARSTEQNVH